MFTKMISVFFAQASFSHTSWNHANIDIWKHCMQQCLTFILMVY